MGHTCAISPSRLPKKDSQDQSDQIVQGEQVVSCSSFDQEKDPNPERSLVFLKDQLNKLRQEEHDLISKTQGNMSYVYTQKSD